MRPKVSVIIPSYKDPLLHKTIASVLASAEGPIEVIAVLDGYWHAQPLPADPRVTVLHLGQNRGMRDAINVGVAASTGEYILRTDEHCLFDQGFDVKLTSRFKPNWIVYPTRYYLDPERWAVMDLAPNVYNKLVIDPQHGKFAGVNWHSREQARMHKVIDPSMAMQGSCWIMRREWWDSVIGALQTDGYGPLYQDSIEMVFKTWQAGGHLMVNKSTWYAHKHRSFARTHNHDRAEAEAGWRYALSVWGEYYQSEVVPRWLS